MTTDRAFRQYRYDEDHYLSESWGLYFDFANHDLKDYIQYKDKVEWIVFYKCGEGYWGDCSMDDNNKKLCPIKNLKLLKLFTNIKYISAHNKTGFTHGQQKEIHKIIKKRKLKQRGIIGINRENQRSDNKSGFMYCCPRSPLSKYGYNHREKTQVTMYNRGTGRYKYSILKYYVIPKFWKNQL
jgi:hypothetical protein